MCIHQNKLGIYLITNQTLGVGGWVKINLAENSPASGSKYEGQSSYLALIMVKIFE